MGVTYRVDEKHGRTSRMQVGEFGHVIHPRVDDDPLEVTTNCFTECIKWSYKEHTTSPSLLC